MSTLQVWIHQYLLGRFWYDLFHTTTKWDWNQWGSKGRLAKTRSWSGRLMAIWHQGSSPLKSGKVSSTSCNLWRAECIIFKLSRIIIKLVGVLFHRNRADWLVLNFSWIWPCYILVWRAWLRLFRFCRLWGLHSKWLHNVRWS